MEEVPQAEKAGCVIDEAPTQNAVPEFCSVLANIAEQQVNRGERQKVGTTMRLNSDANLDSGVFCRKMGRADECKRIFDDSGDKKLAGEGFRTDIVVCESDSSVYKAVLYRKDALAVL